MGVTNKTPSEGFEVKFVEATNTQYVDTGLYITGPFELNHVMMAPYSMSRSWGRLFGVGNSISSKYNYCQYMFQNNNTGTGCFYSSDDGGNYASTTTGVGNRISSLNVHNVDDTTTNVYWDFSLDTQDGIWRSGTTTINQKVSYEKASAGTLYLFANNNTLDNSGNIDRQQPSHFTGYRLFHFDFSLDNILVSNMVPYNLNGNGYLMDTVRGRLYGNGDLIPGPKKISNFNDEYVDFDLPSGLIWAKWNIGAEYEYDIGEGYQWGSLTASRTPSPEVYDTQSSGVLPLEKDIVHLTMGGNWRLPTRNEFQELLDNTTFQWASVTYGSLTIQGAKFSKTIDGEEKFVFFPVGWYNGNVVVWTSEPSNNTNAYCLFVNNTNVTTPGIYNYFGSGKNMPGAAHGVYKGTITAVYDVNDTSNQTKLLYTTNNMVSMKVDGVVESIDTGYTFGTTGEHTVEFTLNNATSAVGFLFYDCSRLKRVQFPSSITTMGNAVCMNCSNLESVELPNKISAIADNLFNGCSKLENVEIPNRVTAIGSSSFDSCTSLSSINLPNGLTSIGSSAFYNCSSLKDITLPNSLISIGDGCFRYTSLTNVVIPNGITNIPYCSFQIYTMTSITLSNSVTTFGDFAFYGEKITSVDIPNTITAIGDYVFMDCDRLSEVIIRATTPPTIGTSAFDGNASNRTFYVPSESVNDYKNANGWSSFANNIMAIP